MNQLTVAMATFKDFEGVYMTLEVLREFHPLGVDVLVLDNAPTPCTQTRDETIAAGGRYFHRPDLSGTSVSRDRLFDLAQTPWVMVVDSHIVLCRGTIEAALRYIKEHPVSRDLIQGPMVNSGITRGTLTHWNPPCENCLWGEWDGVPEGNNPQGYAFEIPMQGLGLYLMRKESWPGFNKFFMGFGGEEGYISEKVRQKGGRTLCLPGLRWRHRFRKQGTAQPYPRLAYDHAWNLLIGHRELGYSKEAEIKQHHAKGAPDKAWGKLVNDAEKLQPLGVLQEPAPKIRLLGVWYSNNAAPDTLLLNSLRTIKNAADSSRHLVEVTTCSWEPVLGNPFKRVIHKPAKPGHAAVLEQMEMAINAAVDDYDAVVFLEHDVLYPPDYFDRIGAAFAANPAALVVSNLDYAGLNATGWLAVKERHEPMHQLSMRKDFALANLARAKVDCQKQGWAFVEPEGDRKDWVRIGVPGLYRATGPAMPAIHVNHTQGRLTSHGEVVYAADSGGKTTHPFWGEAKDWWPGEMKPSTAAPQKAGCCGSGKTQAVVTHYPANEERGSLDSWYAAKLKTQRDCNEHLPTVKELAERCSHVTEITAWNKWLVALAHCPARVASYAGRALESWPDMAKLLGDRFHSEAVDSLDAEVEPTELLIIDTLHQAGRLYQELVRHHEKVSKWIVVHCTQTYGEKGDDGGPGVLPGLRRFLREHPTWNVRDYYPNNHGMVVLTRAGEDRKELPGLPTQAKNYLAAKVKQWLKGPGLLPLEMAEKRLEVCYLCPVRQDDRCSACGCYLEVIDPDGKNPAVPASERGKPGRAFHGWQGCPIGKWGPIDAKTIPTD